MQWNSMKYLVIARLRRPTVGFVGRCSSQLYDLSPEYHKVSWIGGAWQVYLPDLTASDVGVCWSLVRQCAALNATAV